MGAEGESKKHVWPDPGAPAANGQSLSLTGLQHPKYVSKICPLRLNSSEGKEDLTRLTYTFALVPSSTLALTNACQTH
jgi:hypothetical protein